MLVLAIEYVSAIVYVRGEHVILGLPIVRPPATEPPIDLNVGRSIINVGL